MEHIKHPMIRLIKDIELTLCKHVAINGEPFDTIYDNYECLEYLEIYCKECKTVHKLKIAVG